MGIALASTAVRHEEGNRAAFEIERVRRDFPALAQLGPDGKPLVYLDSAATAHKPRVVIDALRRFYEEDYANIHRGTHALSNRATLAYEAARGAAAELLGAQEAAEIVFVRGCTEAINLVAHCYGALTIGAGDEIVVSEMEHHSNFVPWQQLCAQRGVTLRVAPIDERGQLELDRLEELLSPRTKLLAIAHVSNVLGTINPVARIVELAHAHGAKVLVDGAQAVTHLPVDVQALDCDFYAFSGHKLYGPTGIGVLYGKRELLESMPPYQTGGGMVDLVEAERTTFLSPPLRFEAGTPHIAGAVGLGAAIEYLKQLGLAGVAEHEDELLSYATRALEGIDGLELVGRAAQRTSVLSFNVKGVHAQDLGALLDEQGIAVRTGHHCAQPVMHRYGISGTVRASLGLYNTRSDIDALVAGLDKALGLLR